MPAFSIRDLQDAEDFVRGCTFYGTGGGGSPEYGLGMLQKVLKQGKEINVINSSDVADSAWTCTAYGMGSIAPRTPKILAEMKGLGLTKASVEYKLLEALRELERFSKKKVSVIVPVEIGGANTPDPVATAALAGLKAVDGDYEGGRAVPEGLQSMPHLVGRLMVPLVSVDEWGNTVILKNAVNNRAAEKIGKLIAVLAYGNLAGNATWLFKGSEMKKMLTPGTLSRAFDTGKKIRKMREEGTSLGEFSKSIGARLVFEGRVTEKVEENRDAEYYWGWYSIGGSGPFRGHALRVWFKNENHLTWLDGKPFVTSPDLITAIDLGTGEPRINPGIMTGDKLAIFAVPAFEIFRSKMALEYCGPRHWGFDLPYVPLERVLKAP